jgi:hypothetical protein
METPLLAESAGMLIRNFNASELKLVFTLYPSVLGGFVRKYAGRYR